MRIVKRRAGEKGISRGDALDAVRLLLRYIGESPLRDGLVDTPERFLKAWEQHWGASYDVTYMRAQLASIMGGLFKGAAGSYNEMIVVRKLKFFSHCEHHLAPFFGTVDIAYIPADNSILGLSKFGRIVSMHARRLQVQERLTDAIATQVADSTGSSDVAVLVRAQHLCMMSRGVEQPVSDTVTSSLRGEFYDNQATRAEFMRLVNHANS